MASPATISTIRFGYGLGPHVTARRAVRHLDGLTGRDRMVSKYPTMDLPDGMAVIVRTAGVQREDGCPVTNCAKAVSAAAGSVCMVVIAAANSPLDLSEEAASNNALRLNTLATLPPTPSPTSFNHITSLLNDSENTHPLTKTIKTHISATTIIR